MPDAIALPDIFLIAAVYVCNAVLFPLAGIITLAVATIGNVAVALLLTGAVALVVRAACIGSGARHGR